MYYRSNGCDPNLLTTAERLDEAAAILATGILRLRQKKADKSDNSENICLDKPVGTRPHVIEIPEKGRMT